jgi:hypothetical protein
VLPARQEYGRWQGGLVGSIGPPSSGAGYIGLHPNGTARIVEAAGDNGERSQVERWVEVHVQEAYVHCRKHLPRLVKAANGELAWGTDDARAKGGDYFSTSREPRP